MIGVASTETDQARDGVEWTWKRPLHLNDGVYDLVKWRKEDILDHAAKMQVTLLMSLCMSVKSHISSVTRVDQSQSSHSYLHLKCLGPQQKAH